MQRRVKTPHAFPWLCNFGPPLYNQNQNLEPSNTETQSTEITRAACKKKKNLLTNPPFKIQKQMTQPAKCYKPCEVWRYLDQRCVVPKAIHKWVIEEYESLHKSKPKKSKWALAFVNLHFKLIMQDTDDNKLIQSITESSKGGN